MAQKPKGTNFVTKKLGQNLSHKEINLRYVLKTGVQK